MSASCIMAKPYILVEEGGRYGVEETTTGKKVFPACGEAMKDLHAYYTSSCGSEGAALAMELLSDVFEGGTPITNMARNIHEMAVNPQVRFW